MKLAGLEMSNKLNTIIQEQDPAFLQIQADRDGWRWWSDALVPPDPVSVKPSATPVSAAALEMMIAFCVRDREVYDQEFSKAYWPGQQTGVTIGIGYDLGYSTSAHVAADWESHIGSEWTHKLVSGLGIHGEPAGSFLAGYFNKAGLDIPWDMALAVFAERVVPRWVGIVERALQGTDKLTRHQLGALVSLASSRGAHFVTPGDDHAEMRQIAEHMKNAEFDKIPGRIRAMARLWPDRPGLRNRRHIEAMLFETGSVSAL
jgi:hypothetical protein